MAAPTITLTSCKVCCKRNFRAILRLSHCQYLNWIVIRRFADAKPIVSSDMKFVASVEEDFQSNSVTFRKHPGVTRLKAVSLPDQLLHSVDVILRKFPSKDLVANASKLSRYLWGRKPPVEDHEIRRQAQEIYNKILSKEGSQLQMENCEKLETMLQKKTVSILRQQTYHWQPVNYTAYNAYLYMVARLPTEYAVVLQIFSEIQRRHKNYAPQSLYDIGSGVGSVVWAGHRLWGKSLKQYYCVDPSSDMNTLARLLLQDGEEDNAMCIPGVHFRQFVPSGQNKFDVTVSAYTLFEVATRKDREKFLYDMWNKTLHYMVLVDNGSNAGFRLIMEARDYILQLRDDDPTLKGHVFAPCPHNSECPMLGREKKSVCAAEITYKPLPITPKGKSTERYSYVVLSKLKPQVRWPRVVQEVLKPSHHTHIHICDDDAQLKHLVITYSKHSRDLYRSSRYTKLGDTFPVIIPHKDSNQDTPPTPSSELIDSEEAWSLQDMPTKVNMPQSGRYMVQCSVNEMDS